MKFAIVDFAGFGGLAQYSYQLSQALSRKGAGVLLITAKGSELNAFPRDFDLVNAFDRYRTKSLDLRYALAKLKDFHPDVVHVQGSDHPEIYLPILLLLKLIWRTRIAFTAHETRVHKGLPISGLLVRSISKVSDKVFVLNRKAFDDLHGDGTVMDGKIIYFPHGDYSFPFFQNILMQPVEKATDMLFFGRIDKTKGLDMLLEAFSIVHKSYPSVRLIIAGRVLEKVDSWHHYQALIEKYSLADFIDLDLRYIPMMEVPGYFNRAKVVVLPYRRTNQSGVIPLAYAFARPVIATKVGGLPEMVQDGVNGLLVQNGDVAGLAEAILKLFKVPGLAAKYGEGGRRFAETVLPWDGIADKHISVFQTPRVAPTESQSTRVVQGPRARQGPGLKGQNIICFSNDWDQDPLSKHHIMSRLAKQNRVLWINSIGMRLPRASRQDFKKMGVKVTGFVKNVKRVEENLYVMESLVIPLHFSERIAGINRGLLLMQVKRVQRLLVFDRPILWTFLPNAHGVFGGLGEKLSLYYITDDFTHFTGYPSEAIARMEEELIGKCDTVIASAQRLAENKAFGGKKIAVVHHGVDYDHFAKALCLRPEDWPKDIQSIKHPIIGFYGEINDWLDLKTLARVAAARRDWSFVLIGRIAVEVGNIAYLTNLPNVYWLGQKKFGELYRYSSAFDVALIPMKLNELTLNVNPLKLREYLAAGVPVVSAPLPEVLSFGDVCKFATTPEEYVTQIEAFLKRDKKGVASVLSQRVSQETWDARVEKISAIIEQALIAKNAI